MDRIAQTRGSARSSRANTPTGNSFNQPQQQQSMPAFQPPPQVGGSGFGGDFNFTAMGASSNPFANQNGASGTPPPTFQFGAPPQQNGGGNSFGNNNTSFGSAFGSNNNSQPQQNGFNPSTSMFGQNNNNSNNNAAPIFGGFGQNNNQSQPQQNGLTPSTNNSFPSFGQQNGESNIFKGFGASQPQTQSTPSTSFGGFGQNTQQNGEKEKTPSFGGFGQGTQQNNEKSTTPAFGGFGQNAQQNGDKPLFGASPQPEQPATTKASTPFTFGQTSSNQQNGAQSLFAPSSQAPATSQATTSTSGLFGAQANGAKGLFGASPPPTAGSSTPNLGKSVLSGLDHSRLSTIKPNMFTSDTSATPKPSTSNLFNFQQSSQQAGESAPGAGEETPKPSNLFGGAGPSQVNGVKSNLFGNTSTSQPEQQTQTPKPSSHLFSGAFGQPASQQSNTPAFSFGQSQQDTSMLSPDNTPQKQNGSTPAASAPEHSSTSETPAGKSLFERISRDPPATAPKFSNLFGQVPSTANDAETPAGQGKSLFERISHEPPATAPKPSFTPVTSLFSQPTEKPAATAAAPSAAPWLSMNKSPLSAPPEHPSTTVPPAITTTAATPAATASSKATTMTDVIPQSEKDTLKVLNEGLRLHLAKADSNSDWTTIMQFYQRQAAKIRNKPEPRFEAPTAPATKSAPSFGSSGSEAPALVAKAAATSNLFSAAQAPSTPAPAQQAPSSSAGTLFSSKASETPRAPTSNLFASAASKAPTSSNLFAAQTPKPASSDNFLKPPATAPVNKKRAAEDDAGHIQPPATEKRRRADDAVEYPKLPANASETSKLFQSVLDRPANDAVDEEKERQVEEAREKAEREKKESEQRAKQIESSATPFKPATAGFMPSTSAFKPATSGFAPSAAPSAPAAPSVMPAFSAPPSSTGGFLAAFGKKANEEEEKQKKKRKAEDYDSDEETEEAWEARDKAEQEAKKQKVRDATPTGMPTFSAPTNGSNGFLAAFGQRANDEEEKQKKKRKAEDYDSDEETEEAWEARDKAEQEAKRQKIQDAAKSGSGFVFTPSAGPSEAGDDSAAEKEKTPAPEALSTTIGKSLFDRITPADPPTATKTISNLFSAQTSETSKAPSNLFSANTPSAFSTQTSETPKTTSTLFGAKTPSAFGGALSTSNIFGNLAKTGTSSDASEKDKAQPEKEQGFGDNTWKPNTPIKFGASTTTGTESTTPAAPPPVFGNLFGANAQKPSADSTGHLNVPAAKAPIGFNFGGTPSLAGSRATTPGVTTDGEGASTAGEGDNEPSDEAPQNEPQAEDLTGLQPEELEHEDCIFQVAIAKAKKWEDKKGSEVEMSQGWVDKGKGPLYMLKHKDTGVTRVVLKVPPYGNPAMNFALLKGAQYSVQGPKKQYAQGMFVDHLTTKNKGLSKWLIQVSNGVGEQLAEVMMEQRPQ